MKKLFSVLLLTIIILSFCSCGKGNNKINSTFDIQFDSNPTTGYVWSYSIENSNVVKITRDEYIPDKIEEGFCGGGGKHYFTLEAINEGETSVTFSYARSWENESIQTVVKHITVDKNNNITVND